MRKIPCFAAAVLITLFNTVLAQDAPSTALKFEQADGLVLKQDTLFGMTFRFRMQNRAWFFSESGSDLTPAETDMRIRRMRLRFDGHVLSPKLLYRVQLGFSRADLDLIEGETAQPIRDAMIYYRPSAQWQFGFGQTKLPGNRQRVISSGALQLPERSRVNALFTLDRDFGGFVEWHGNTGDQHVRLKGAITTGEGRNAPPGGPGLCYTARAEWLPFGTFTNDGDYFEGDLEREERPKLSFGASISTNLDARRAGGQLGPEFAGGEQRTLNVFIADALLKYRGLAISSEYLQRLVEGDPMTGDLFGNMVTAYEGWGWNSQVSQLFGSRWEIVSRYSIVQPGERIRHLRQRAEEVWLGSTYYLNHHRIKFQACATYFWFDGKAFMVDQNDQWGLMLQAEFGI
jgi:phosphate-selective porin OprO and OprP